MTAVNCRLCGEPLTETFVDLGMSPLCESYVPPARLDGPETFYPLHVLIQAKRSSAIPIFASAPQQSDYAPRWVDATLATGTMEKPAVFPPPARPWLSKVAPGLARLVHVLRMGLDLYRRESIFWNRKAFRRVKKQ